MTWHDAVISMGSLVGAAALIPMVFHSQKPPLSSSVPTAIVLTIFLPTYASLGLWFSVATIGMGCFLWWVLVIQRIPHHVHEAKRARGKKRIVPKPRSGGSLR